MAIFELKILVSDKNCDNSCKNYCFHALNQSRYSKTNNEGASKRKVILHFDAPTSKLSLFYSLQNFFTSPTKSPAGRLASRLCSQQGSRLCSTNERC